MNRSISVAVMFVLLKFLKFKEEEEEDFRSDEFPACPLHVPHKHPLARLRLLMWCIKVCSPDE